jgi:hypothetical protein
MLCIRGLGSVLHITSEKTKSEGAAEIGNMAQLSSSYARKRVALTRRLYFGVPVVRIPMNDWR